MSATRTQRSRKTTTAKDVTIKLPEGWQGNVEHGGRYFVIAAPKMGYVTLDFQERSFRLGATWAGPLEGNTYEGRGWRQALADAAVARLKEVYEAYR